jgi:type III secretion protein V
LRQVLASVLTVPGKIRWADVTLIGGLAAVLMLLILPMPPFILDMAIAFNLSVGILLLLSVLYISKPLDFSTFPTVLLLTTLFRIAISVSTARMILSEMNAGHIVKQFGNMVAAGNIVIGLVVFLIITIFQFIVVAKGAERVAEVAARFSLDAMPGKQLSIDSDLRSGLLGKDEAREKRRTLELESKLHGSLDGAMKFVKGDAIAAIVVVIINLLGGIAVGMFYHNLSAAESVQIFSILSIGDGLVALLPAFFSAIAAGLLVTRTTDEERDAELGPAIARQLSGKPHVLITGGGMMMLMGLIPGFPILIFFALGLGAIAAGAWSHPVSGAWIRNKISPDAATNLAALSTETMVAPSAIKALDQLLLTVTAPEGEALNLGLLSARVAKEVERLQDESGVPVPAVRLLAGDAATLGAGTWSLSAYGAPLGTGTLDAEEFIARVSIITRELLRRNIGIFLGLQEVTDLLNQLGEDYPEVVKEAVRSVSTGKIAEVLRLLAEEGVSLRNLRDPIQAIPDIVQNEHESFAIAERVRVTMRRHLIAPYCQNGRLAALMVGSELEDVLRNCRTQVDGDTRLAINPHQMQALIALLREQLDASKASVILTSMDIRRPLRLLIAGDLFHVPVISFNELNPAVPLDIVGELTRAPDALADHSVPEFAE